MGLAVLLFGSNKIPELARSLGSAKREFDAASKGLVDTINSEINVPQQPPGMMQRPMSQPVSVQASTPASEVLSDSDPLVVAARSEGIDTRGKTRSQIAAELASKVKD